MSDKNKFSEIMKQVDPQDLWVELARRYGVRFGKIEKVFHEGRPSDYTNLELRHKEEITGLNLKTIS